MSVDILKKQLKDGVFSNIYLFFGEEDFLKEYYYNQLKSKIVDKSFEDFNFCFYEGKNIDLQQEKMQMMELLNYPFRQK